MAWRQAVKHAAMLGLLYEKLVAALLYEIMKEGLMS
jgi:hypothetical protein